MNTRSNPSWHRLALVLSIIIHAVIVVRVFGIPLPDFGQAAQEMFVASLVQDAGIQPRSFSFAGTNTDPARPRAEASGKPTPEAKKDQTADDRVLASPAAEAVTSQLSAGASAREQSTETGVSGIDEVVASVFRSLDAPVERAAPPVSAPVFVPDGRETFHFDIYWLGVLVGHAVLEAVSEKGVTTITSQVHSSSFVSTFYKVEDYAEAKLVNGAPSVFKIRQREGKYRSDKETIFDSGSGTITFHNYLKGTKDEHAAPARLPWDVISGFYHLRTHSFEVGKPLSIAIFDSNKFFDAEVSVLKKERVKFGEKGEQDTVIVKPVLKSEGLFQNKGEILIWLTDDERKIPVRVETKVPIGTVVAELTKVQTDRKSQ